MFNAFGNITDTYTYDAYGVILKKDGTSSNSYLYTQESYNEETGLYNLRARYMDPGTGSFTTRDSYQGSIYDPVSLHKYLYANANPVKYTDPTGYYSMADASAATAINSTLTGMMQISVRSILKKALVNAIIATELSIIDSTLGGASLTQVGINALLAFGTGFVASAGVLKLMTFFRTITSLEIFLCIAGTSSIGFGAFGAIDSAENGNYLQAAYRFALGVFGAVESAKGIRDIEAAIKASKPKVETPEPSGKGGSKYGIDVDNLNFSNTVSGHDNRPYQDSKLLINEIINSSEPIQDPQGTNALYWEVDGSFNESNGIYELLIDPETNTVWHFVYKSK